MLHAPLIEGPERTEAGRLTQAVRAERFAERGSVDSAAVDALEAYIMHLLAELRAAREERDRALFRSKSPDTTLWDEGQRIVNAALAGTEDWGYWQAPTAPCTVCPRRDTTPTEADQIGTAADRQKRRQPLDDYLRRVIAEMAALRAEVDLVTRHR